jgi:hypothetical protein
MITTAPRADPNALSSHVAWRRKFRHRRGLVESTDCGIATDACYAAEHRDHSRG